MYIVGKILQKRSKLTGRTSVYAGLRSHFVIIYMSCDNIFFRSTSLKQMFFYDIKLSFFQGVYISSLKTTNEVKCCMEIMRSQVHVTEDQTQNRMSCSEFCMFALLFSSIILFKSSQLNFPRTRTSTFKKEVPASNISRQ